MILEKWKILNIVDNKACFLKTLELISTVENKVIKCQLKSQWYLTPVSSGQIVYIRGKEEENLIIIDEKFGYICLYPDTLISGTAIVGSIFCSRKGVLQQKFGQLDGANKSVRIFVISLTNFHNFF